MLLFALVFALLIVLTIFVRWVGRVTDRRRIARLPGRNAYVVYAARHPWLCRWWIRWVEGPLQQPEEALQSEIPGAVWIPGRPVTAVVPWWAWPLELIHIAFFGRSRLRAIEMHEQQDDAWTELAV